LEVPAAAISLRAIDPERYAIVNEEDGDVIEEIEESKAFYEVYDGAVYMFQVGTYLKTRFRFRTLPTYRNTYSCSEGNASAVVLLHTQMLGRLTEAGSHLLIKASKIVGDAQTVSQC
jgi:hypothetical protein